MAIYDSNSKEARNLKGVHLYHFKDSNCSQRCRLALELKKVAWHSHHIDLARKEHHDPRYTAINPNAVVPTLVHDGTVVLESNDIIDYIDDQFEGDRLKPDRQTDQIAVRKLLDASTRIQISLKTLSHEYLFWQRRSTSIAEADSLERSGKNPILVKFLRDFVQNGKQWADRLEEAHADVETRLNDLEARLTETAAWLSGPDYGLADISWAVNYYRLQLCQYDMIETERVLSWGTRAVARPAFVKAVVDFQP